MRLKSVAAQSTPPDEVGSFVFPPLLSFPSLFPPSVLPALLFPLDEPPEEELPPPDDVDVWLTPPLEASLVRG